MLLWRRLCFFVISLSGISFPVPITSAFIQPKTFISVREQMQVLFPLYLESKRTFLNNSSASITRNMLRARRKTKSPYASPTERAYPAKAAAASLVHTSGSASTERNLQQTRQLVNQKISNIINIQSRRRRMAWIEKQPTPHPCTCKNLIDCTLGNQEHPFTIITH